MSNYLPDGCTDEMCSSSPEYSPGVAPGGAKILHLASKVDPNGKVSALCFKRPRAIDLSRESWTIRNEAVTCEACIKAHAKVAPGGTGEGDYSLPQQKRGRKPYFHIDIMPIFRPGEPPPSGYLEWHQWAQVQLKAGIRQKRCSCHGLWKFPNEGCRACVRS